MQSRDQRGRMFTASLSSPWEISGRPIVFRLLSNPRVLLTILIIAEVIGCTKIGRPLISQGNSHWQRWRLTYAATNKESRSASHRRPGRNHFLLRAELLFRREQERKYRRRRVRKVAAARELQRTKSHGRSLRLPCLFASSQPNSRCLLAGVPPRQNGYCCTGHCHPEVIGAACPPSRPRCSRDSRREDRRILERGLLRDGGSFRSALRMFRWAIRRATATASGCAENANVGDNADRTGTTLPHQRRAELRLPEARRPSIRPYL